MYLSKVCDNFSECRGKGSTRVKKSSPTGEKFNTHTNTEDCPLEPTKCQQPAFLVVKSNFLPSQTSTPNEVFSSGDEQEKGLFNFVTYNVKF